MSDLQGIADRAEIEVLRGEYTVQTTHPGAIQVDGDTATGRACLCEVGRRLAEIHHRYGPGTW